MMSALRELGVGGQAAATSTSAAGAAPAGSAVAPSAAVAANDETATAARAGEAPVSAAATQGAASKGDVESAVYQFAHELMKALRPGAGAEGGGEGRRDDGEYGGHRHHHRTHGHHGHHGHHGWRREGYGDMSQRLDALAQRFGPQQPDAASPAPTASSISITLTAQNGANDLSVPAAEVEAEAKRAPVAEPLPATALVADESPVTQPKDPLLDAFSKLFSALQPQVAQGMSEADMGGKLRMFLQALSQALKPEGVAAPEAPTVGGLIDLAA
ncbi:MAG: hypothetical protein OEY03_13835, partial [Rhizobacter sp.]|nr:hypothetical protein [Rhizobacter sp.]